MSSPLILGTTPIDLHWPTLDPFLFCAHHDDNYPAGNARLGVDASGIRSRHVHTGGRVVRVDDLDMPDKRVCLHRVHARHVHVQHGEHDARVREDVLKTDDRAAV